jgi:hypothetical protein
MGETRWPDDEEFGGDFDLPVMTSGSSAFTPCPKKRGLFHQTVALQQRFDVIIGLDGHRLVRLEGPIGGAESR